MSTVDSNASLTAHVAAFRRFNRMYTRFIGVLDEEFLNSGYSLVIDLLIPSSVSG
jgi:hypothetical protein